MKIRPFFTPIASPENNEPAQPGWHIKKLLQQKWFSFIFKLGCTILLFTLLFKSMPVSWPGMFQKLNSLDDGGLLIGVIVGLFGVIISAYQWQVLLDAEHIRVDLRRLINLYLVGIAFNHFLPTGMGGDIVKAYYVSKKDGNATGSASAVVMTRITGFLGMLLVSIPALLIWHALFPKNFIILFLLSCLTLCAALGGILCCVTLLPRLLVGRERKYRLLVPIIKTGHTLRKSITKPRSIAGAVVCGAFFHASAILNYYNYALLLNIHIPLAFYLVAIPFVSLVAFLPISLNGFGLREGTIVATFALVHVPINLAFSLAILMDLQVLFFGIIGGGVYLLMAERRGGRASGTPQTPAGGPCTSFLLTACGGEQKREKEFFGDTPNPGREDPAPLFFATNHE